MGGPVVSLLTVGVLPSVGSMVIISNGVGANDSGTGGAGWGGFVSGVDTGGGVSGVSGTMGVHSMGVGELLEPLELETPLPSLLDLVLETPLPLVLDTPESLLLLLLLEISTVPGGQTSWTSTHCNERERERVGGI